MSWFLLALIVAAVGGLILTAVGAVRVKNDSSTWKGVVTAALLWVWAWGVLAMTFGTRSGGGSALNLEPLDVANQSDVINFALNVLMFVPVGVLLAIRGTRVWKSVVVAACASLAIEVMQYVLATGRTADLNDLIANVAGCVLGFLLTAGVIRARVRERAKP